MKQGSGGGGGIVIPGCPKRGRFRIGGEDYERRKPGWGETGGGGCGRRE